MSDGLDLIHLPVVNDIPETVELRRSVIEAASWMPTVDGYAEIAITLKNGSVHIHKVERHTAIRACRDIMSR